MRSTFEAKAKTLSEAKKMNLKSYFTGKPCSKGHLAFRYVTSRRCSQCSFETRNSNYQSEWFKKNPEKRKEYSRRYREKHRGKLYNEKIKQNSLRWSKNNPHKRAAIAAVHRAAKKGIRKNEKAVIDALYRYASELSRLSGIKFTVDHIFPLKSDWICGLHVFENLRVITARENSSKGNRRGPIHDLHSYLKENHNDK